MWVDSLASHVNLHSFTCFFMHHYCLTAFKHRHTHIHFTDSHHTSDIEGNRWEGSEANCTQVKHLRQAFTLILRLEPLEYKHCLKTILSVPLDYVPKYNYYSYILYDLYNIFNSITLVWFFISFNYRN